MQHLLLQFLALKIPLSLDRAAGRTIFGVSIGERKIQVFLHMLMLHENGV
jgi:hypothetical protein